MEFSLCVYLFLLHGSEYLGDFDSSYIVIAALGAICSLLEGDLVIIYVLYICYFF